MQAAETRSHLLAELDSPPPLPHSNFRFCAAASLCAARASVCANTPTGGAAGAVDVGSLSNGAVACGAAAAASTGGPNPR
jgi:hypothetical protein